ncbi:MAG: RNA 2',3'-cyclic phosphodiesterase [Fimbriiglobus sp.]
MARLRTFIAVEIDTSTRQKVATLQRILATLTDSVNWVEPQNIHVTLLFLGEVDDRDIPGIHKILKNAARKAEPFNLECRGLGAFPTPRRPKVLWAGIESGAEELVALHTAMETPLLELGGYRQEERAYTPHLTLGRITSDEDAAKLALEIPKQATWSSGQTTIEELLLFSSELRRSGPEYTVLARAPLGS